jgi:lipopolysaccharide export system protein LptA
VRPLLLVIALSASLPVFSQDKPSIRFEVVRNASGARLNGTVNSQSLLAKATSVQGDNVLRVIHLTGNVEITLGGMNLQADAVDFHWDSGELEPSGSVRINPIQP